MTRLKKLKKLKLTQTQDKGRKNRLYMVERTGGYNFSINGKNKIFIKLVKPGAQLFISKLSNMNKQDSLMEELISRA